MKKNEIYEAIETKLYHEFHAFIDYVASRKTKTYTCYGNHHYEVVEYVIYARDFGIEGRYRKFYVAYDVEDRTVEIVEL